MKIEKIKFSNINSLAGEFEIDFTSPGLSSQGIFCITGPTGSGKTTILDAICFALYRRTPRMDQEVSKNNNEILTKGAHQCYAQLIFSHEGKRYLTKVSHSRSKGSTPFGQAKHEVSTQDQNGQWQLLSNSLTEIKQLIPGITKLDFANFTRCIMLAQGQFAAFLKAEERERAAILTAITHTEHYGEIGKKVQEKEAELKKELNNFPKIEPLTAEQRASLEADINTHTQQLNSEQELLDSLKIALEWHHKCKDSQNRVTQAENKQKDALSRLDELLKTGAESRILQAVAAMSVQPHVTKKTEIFAELSRLNADLPTLIQVHQDAQEQQQQDKTAVELCHNALNTRGRELSKLLLDIDEHMRPQEEQLSLCKQAATEAAARLRKEQMEWSESAEESATCQHKYQQAEKELNEKQAAFETVQDDVALSTHLPIALAQWNIWKKNSLSETTLPTTQELQQSLDSTSTSIEHILQGLSPQQWDTHVSRLQYLYTANQDYCSAAQRATQAKEAHKQQLEQLAEIPACDEVQQQLAAAEAKVQLVSNLLSMEEKLSELYTQLKEGKLSACPCCGSTTYGQRHITINQEYKQAEAALQKAKNELDTLHKRRQDAQNKCAITEASARESQKSADLAYHKLQQALQDCAFDNVPPNLDDLCAQTKQQAQQLQVLQSNLENLKAKLLCASLRDNFYEALAPCSDERPPSASAAKHLLAALQHKEKTYTKYKHEQESAQASLVEAKLHKEGADKALAQAEQRFHSAQSDHQQKENAFRKQKEAFIQQWGEGNTAGNLSANFNKELSDLKEKLGGAKEQLASAENKLTKASTDLRHAQTRAVDLQEQLKTAEITLQQSLSNNGFASIEEYRIAEGYIADKTRLENQIQEYRENVNVTSALAEREKEEYNALQAQIPPHGNLSEVDILSSQQQHTTILQELKQALKILEIQLIQDNNKLIEIEQQELKAASLRAEYHRWSKLFEIMGGNAEGFMRFAQQISLDYLIANANKELKKFSDRFKLIRGHGSMGLDLDVIDYELDDEKPRSCSNLSGGESFIVSLALALGLSSMSSTACIDTLFLDEGFGTLDNETLNQVLSSLDTMRAEGKMIGIITHMDKLSDRISARLEVQPTAGGMSTILPHSAVIATPGFN